MNSTFEGQAACFHWHIESHALKDHDVPVDIPTIYQLEEKAHTVYETDSTSTVDGQGISSRMLRGTASLIFGRPERVPICPLRGLKEISQ